MRIRHTMILIATLVLGMGVAAAQDNAATTLDATPTAPPTGAESNLQRFVIERDIPGAGKMTLKELREAAGQSNKVLRELGPDIQWVQSYVTGDKLYCVYNARSAELIELHAKRSGFPANRITPVAAVIDPTTANAP